MRKIEAENVALAIGVCSAMSDMAYRPNAETQSEEWHALRHAVFYLKDRLEVIASEEVTYAAQS